MENALKRALFTGGCRRNECEPAFSFVPTYNLPLLKSSKAERRLLALLGEPMVFEKQPNGHFLH
jgi:hypothetical protein